MTDGKPDAVMMFAAGFGTRMKHLTKDRPKPLLEVAGIALIDHALALVDEIKPRKIVVNTHFLGDQIADHLCTENITLSPEHPDILDTGGGLKAALPLLGNGPVITMNTDAIWSGANPLQALLSSWDPGRMDALLMCIPTQAVHGHEGPGDFEVSNDGRIKRGSGVVYGGAQIIKTDALQGVSQRIFSLNLLWNLMQDQQRLFALVYDGEWCDVGHPGGIALAEALLRNSDV